MTDFEKQSLSLLSSLLFAQNLQLQKSLLNQDVWQELVTSHMNICRDVLRNVERSTRPSEGIPSPDDGHASSNVSSS